MIQKMMSLPLAFLSIVHSSEQEPRLTTIEPLRALAMRPRIRGIGSRMRMTDPRLSESSLGKACKHEWQCGADTECDGGERDEVHGNIGASGVEVLSDEHDITVDIQLKVSAEEPFPWEELLQQVFGRIGGKEQ